MAVGFRSIVVVAAAMALSSLQLRAQGAAAHLTVEHVERLPNAANPELLYWFLSPPELEPAAYRSDLDLVAANGTFDFLFLTQRGAANFYDFPKMHPIFKDLVSRAHEKGLKVGLQLWTRERGVPRDQLQGIVVENEVQLDDKGKGVVAAHTSGVRLTGPVGGPLHFLYAPVYSQLLGLYAFKKKADGLYAPGTLVDLTSRAATSSPDAGSVTFAVDDPQLAGYTLYAMTVHYHQFPDMFSPFLVDSFVEALKAYRDVGFDGTALDEFRYMTVGRDGDKPFRERFYSAAMARFFERQTGAGLIRSLFEMRYVPEGDAATRIRAIDNYFDVLRQGPLSVETAFARASTEILGPDCFHGIHDTWHNKLESDEVWGTGINWWTIPRAYGQTDETTPFATRLGIGMAHEKPVEYNQYYTKDLRRFLEEGIDDARFNVRVHYHALNDVQGWGIDLRKPELLAGVTQVEDKVRLLNRFDAPRPAVNVLFLFGFPSLTNWVQKDGRRTEWDINGALQAEDKAVLAWNAGYRVVLAPSDVVDAGAIRADRTGGVLFGGMRFTAVVMVGLEYTKEPTLHLLETFVAGGGRLLLDGTASRGFDGTDISKRFDALAAHAVGTAFSIDAMSALGVPKLALEGGAVYEDGSVVLTDLDSVLQRKPVSFAVTVAGHRFTGSYEGLLALKASPAGDIEKLSAGGLSSLERDGKPVLSLDRPSDLVLLRGVGGGYRATVVGDSGVLLR